MPFERQEPLCLHQQMTGRIRDTAKGMLQQRVLLLLQRIVAAAAAAVAAAKRGETVPESPCCSCGSQLSAGRVADIPSAAAAAAAAAISSQQFLLLLLVLDSTITESDEEMQWRLQAVGRRDACEALERHSLGLKGQKPHALGFRV